MLARLTLDRAIGALGARPAGAARCDGDAHDRRRRGDRSVPAAARPPYAGTAPASRGAWTTRIRRRIARVVGAAAGLDRSRRVLSLAQPVARGAAVGAVGSAPAVAVADLLMTAGDARCAARGRDERLAAHHAAAPDQPGLQFERLRMATPGRPSVAAFRAVIEVDCSAAVRWNRTVRGFGWPRIAPFCRRRMNGCGSRRSELIAAERFRPPRTRDLARRAFGAGGRDARRAEARAADGAVDRGRAGSVLPQRDGGGDGRHCRGHSTKRAPPAR